METAERRSERQQRAQLRQDPTGKALRLLDPTRRRSAAPAPGGMGGEVPPPHPLPYYNSVTAHFFSREPCGTAPEDQSGSPGRSDTARKVTETSRKALALYRHSCYNGIRTPPKKKNRPHAAERADGLDGIQTAFVKSIIPERRGGVNVNLSE